MTRAGVFQEWLRRDVFLNCGGELVSVKRKARSVTDFLACRFTIPKSQRVTLVHNVIVGVVVAILKTVVAKFIIVAGANRCREPTVVSIQSQPSLVGRVIDSYFAP